MSKPSPSKSQASTTPSKIISPSIAPAKSAEKPPSTAATGSPTKSARRVGRGKRRKKKTTKEPNIVVDLREDIVHGHHNVEFSWPFFFPDDDRTIYSPRFSMCGISWQLVARIQELEDEVFLSLHLSNQAEEDIHAIYSLTLHNHLPDGDDIVWEDPEGMMLFSRRSDGDNEWGAEDFVTVDVLDDPESGFVSPETKHFMIRVEVHVQGRLGFNSHEGLSDAIGNATMESELLQLANEDLHEIVSKLPVRKNIKAQKQQEDKIVYNRTNGPPYK